MARLKLTEKQELFAFKIGAEGKSQVDAYIEAYGAGRYTRAIIASKASSVANGAMVAERIEELRTERQNRMLTKSQISSQELFEIYVQIALVDPNELISMRVGCCRHCHGVNGGYQWREREYVAECEAVQLHNLSTPPARHKPFPEPAGGFGFNHAMPPNPECSECCGEGVSRVVPRDTTTLSPGARHLYRGVKVTKDGVQILFADKDKALENIGRMLGVFKDQVRLDVNARLEEYKFTNIDPNEAAEVYKRLLDVTPG